MPKRLEISQFFNLVQILEFYYHIHFGQNLDKHSIKIQIRLVLRLNIVHGVHSFSTYAVMSCCIFQNILSKEYHNENYSLILDRCYLRGNKSINRRGLINRHSFYVTSLCYVGLLIMCRRFFICVLIFCLAEINLLVIQR